MDGIGRCGFIMRLSSCAIGGVSVSGRELHGTHVMHRRFIIDQYRMYDAHSFHDILIACKDTLKEPTFEKITQLVKDPKTYISVDDFIGMLKECNACFYKYKQGETKENYV